MSLDFENGKCVKILKTGKRKGEKCGANVNEENIKNGILFCGRHNKSEIVKKNIENSEKIEITKSNEQEQNALESCILCLKGKGSSDIIYNFLETYSVYHKFNYDKLDLSNLDKDPSLINYIEDYIKDYKNVLIYYTGNGFNNSEGLEDLEHKVFDFPSFKIKHGDDDKNIIIDQHDIMEYFVSNWDKKIIFICDCDNSEEYEYKEKINLKNKKDFKKCNQEINIFNTVNYPIKIASCSKGLKNKSSGLFTLNLFNSLEENLINTLKSLENSFDLLKDSYDIVPENCIEIARHKGFEVNNEGFITNFKNQNKNY
jgi:hypothetical protein